MLDIGILDIWSSVSETLVGPSFTTPTLKESHSECVGTLLEESPCGIRYRPVSPTRTTIKIGVNACQFYVPRLSLPRRGEIELKGIFHT